MHGVVGALQIIVMMSAYGLSRLVGTGSYKFGKNDAAHLIFEDIDRVAGSREAAAAS